MRGVDVEDELLRGRAPGIPRPCRPTSMPSIDDARFARWGLQPELDSRRGRCGSWLGRWRSRWLRFGLHRDFRFNFGSRFCGGWRHLSARGSGDIGGAPLGFTASRSLSSDWSWLKLGCAGWRRLDARRCLRRPWRLLALAGLGDGGGCGDDDEQRWKRRERKPPEPQPRSGSCRGGGAGRLLGCPGERRFELDRVFAPVLGGLAHRRACRSGSGTIALPSASFLSPSSRNQGRSFIQAGAMCPYTSIASPGAIWRTTLEGARSRKLLACVSERRPSSAVSLCWRNSPVPTTART